MSNLAKELLSIYLKEREAFGDAKSAEAHGLDNVAAKDAWYDYACKCHALRVEIEQSTCKEANS